MPKESSGLLTCVLVLAAVTASAQTLAAVHGSIGVGMLFQSNDAAHRLHDVNQGTNAAMPPPVRPMPHVDIGFRITSTLGLDVAVTRIQAVSGTPQSCSVLNVACTALTAEREQETLIHSVVRSRIGRRDRMAFDVFGGVGALIEHATTNLDICVPNASRVPIPACSHIASSTFRASPALVGGFDLPVRIGSRAEAGPVFQLMYLGRGHLNTESEFREPSIKAEFGFAIRGLW